MYLKKKAVLPGTATNGAIHRQGYLNPTGMSTTKGKFFLPARRVGRRPAGFRDIRERGAL
jgi:hypothetical protein